MRRSPLLPRARVPRRTTRSLSLGHLAACPPTWGSKKSALLNEHRTERTCSQGAFNVADFSCGRRVWESGQVVQHGVRRSHAPPRTRSLRRTARNVSLSSGGTSDGSVLQKSALLNEPTVRTPRRSIAPTFLANGVSGAQPGRDHHGVRRSPLPSRTRRPAGRREASR